MGKKREWEETEDTRRIGEGDQEVTSGYRAQYLKKNNRGKSTLTENIIKLWSFLTEDPVKVTMRDGLGQRLDSSETCQLQDTRRVHEAPQAGHSTPCSLVQVLTPVPSTHQWEPGTEWGGPGLSPGIAAPRISSRREEQRAGHRLM